MPPIYIFLSFLQDLPSTRTNKNPPCPLKVLYRCLSFPFLCFLYPQFLHCAVLVRLESGWGLPCTWNPTWQFISWRGLHPNVIGGSNSVEAISVTQQEWLLLRSVAQTQIANLTVWLSHFTWKGTQRYDACLLTDPFYNWWLFQFCLVRAMQRVNIFWSTERCIDT